jgi:hypothetical protein
MMSNFTKDNKTIQQRNIVNAELYTFIRDSMTKFKIESNISDIIDSTYKQTMNYRDYNNRTKK